MEGFTVLNKKGGKMSITIHTEEGQSIEHEYGDESQEHRIIGRTQASEIGLFFIENEGCVFGECEPDRASVEVEF